MNEITRFVGIESLFRSDKITGSRDRFLVHLQNRFLIGVALTGNIPIPKYRLQPQNGKGLEKAERKD